MPGEARIRVYGELNDFLPPDERGRDQRLRFDVAPSVKDAVESLGVPHVEIERIFAEGRPVDWGDPLRDGQRLAVYPQFRRLEAGSEGALRPPPPRPTRFVLDVHLGRLAAYLRMLGFDCLYSNDAGDEELAEAACRDHRILLTRDRGLLMRRVVVYGYFVRETAPRLQAVEVAERYRLAEELAPFTRCLQCNSALEAVAKEEILAQVPPRTAAIHDDFRRCRSCRRVFWQGSHHRRMLEIVEQIRSRAA